MSKSSPTRSVRVSDPKPNVEYGDIYDRIHGTYLGVIGDSVTANKVSIGTPNGQRNETGQIITRVENLEVLSITHTEFRERAAIVYGESSAYAMAPVEDLANEMAALGYVYLRNKVAFGKHSQQAGIFRNTPLHLQNRKMDFANWAVFNAVTGGHDYSNGATMWDGAEQSLYPESVTDGSVSPRRGVSWELHMNTMGWIISEEHYEKWKENVGPSFKAPRVRVSPQNYGGYRNKGKSRLRSTAVYGKTIFWRVV